jgi:outer membrane lipoprotein-sorting protein
MKRSQSILVIVSALALTFLPNGRTEARATPQLLSGILAKMERAHENLQSLRASISQRKVNVQINSSDTDTGTLLYKPSVNGKGRLRIDYTKPDTSTISIVGDTVVFYQPRINQVLKSTVAKTTKSQTNGYSQIFGLDKSVKTLANNFNIEVVKDESIDGRTATILHLVPKSGGSFASVELWVDQESGLPIQQKFVERNGDYTLVKLTNLERNIKLTDEAFVVKYPAGTKVVDRI